VNILNALARYLLQTRANGLSPHTRGSYDRHVRLLAAWLESEGRNTEVEDVDHETIALFLASPAATMRADGKGRKKQASLNSLRTNLKVFFGYLHDAGYTRVNAGRLIRRARCSPPPPRCLSEAEQRRLLDVLDEAEGVEAERDRVLVRLLLGTGIRLGSALAIRTEDVNLEEGEVLLRETKGDRPAVVYLSCELTELLREFQAEKGPGLLFRVKNQNKRAMTGRQARRRTKSWYEKAGANGGTTIHGLRHSFAMRILAKTGDIFLVQAALHHRSIGSTTRYLQCSDSRIRAAINNCSSHVELAVVGALR